MIQRQADKMAGLVSQLLSMTRMEQGVEHMAMGPVDLGELVERLEKEQGWLSKQITIHTAKGCMIKGNEELLGRLIQNLVENARKYSEKDTPVEIVIADTKEEICLSVKDQGIGISEEDQQKIWQRFYQVDSSRSGDEGSGLGLAMVKKIAELHGGRMSLQSTLGEGSKFTLHLPKEI